MTYIAGTRPWAEEKAESDARRAQEPRAVQQAQAEERRKADLVAKKNAIIPNRLARLEKLAKDWTLGVGAGFEALETLLHYAAGHQCSDQQRQDVYYLRERFLRAVAAAGLVKRFWVCHLREPYSDRKGSVPGNDHCERSFLWLECHEGGKVYRQRLPFYLVDFVYSESDWPSGWRFPEQPDASLRLSSRGAFDDHAATIRYLLARASGVAHERCL